MPHVMYTPSQCSKLVLHTATQSALLCQSLFSLPPYSDRLWPHPASYPKCTGGCWPGGKSAGTWSWPPPSSAKVKMGGTIPSLHTSCTGTTLPIETNTRVQSPHSSYATSAINPVIKIGKDRDRWRLKSYNVSAGKVIDISEKHSKKSYIFIARKLCEERQTDGILKKIMCNFYRI